MSEPLQKLTLGSPIVLHTDGVRQWYTLLESPLNSGDQIEVRGPGAIWLRGYFNWSGRKGVNPSAILTPDAQGLGTLKVIIEPAVLCRFVPSTAG
jgi:hypothetical protein